MDEDSEQRLDYLICSLAHFYQGGASIEWLEGQPIPKLNMLYKNASKLNKEMNKEK